MRVAIVRERLMPLTLNGKLSKVIGSAAAMGQRPLEQVLSDRQNEPTTNWPGFTVVTALPTSITMPQYGADKLS
jgi:hypothetical protein